MKNISILCLITLSTFTKAQTLTDTLPTLNNKIVYQRTATVSGVSKTILFNRSKSWLNSYLNSPQNVLNADSIKGQIIVKDYFIESMKGGLFSSDYRFDYKLQIDCRDSIYSLHIFDITYTKTANDDPDPVNAQPLENYYADLKKSTSKSASDNVATLNQKLIAIFFSLRDRINSQSTYNPTPAEIVYCDMLQKQRRRRLGLTTYSSPDNEPIQLVQSTSSNFFSRTITFTMTRSVEELTDQHIYLTLDDSSLLNLVSYNTWIKKGSSKFVYTAVVNPATNDVTTLSTKKILKFRISNSESDVDPVLAAKVKAWMAYLVSFK